MSHKYIALRLTTVGLALLTMASICSAQRYWERIYGSLPSVMALRTDGNIIVIQSQGGELPIAGLSISCVTPNGDASWTKLLPIVDTMEAINSIAPLKDGNFIAVGSITTNSVTMVAVMQISEDGSVAWKKTQYAIGAAVVTGNNISATLDGNFFVLGNYYDTTDRQYKPYLLKINENGDEIWMKEYSVNCNASRIIQARDGNCFIVGDCEEPNDQSCAFLIKTDANGDTVFTRKYVNAGSYGFFDNIVETIDSNLIVAGSIVMEINPNGDTVWTKSIFESTVAAAGDGNYLIASPYELTKLKPDGTTMWSSNEFFDTSVSFWVFNGATVPFVLSLKAGNYLVASGVSSILSTLSVFINHIFSIIDDRYAYKSTPFTFTIPGSDDSLLRTYTPVKVPSGMTVSKGGTITWTPQTDSVYMEHVAFLVTKDTTVKDSLTFNIFVNSPYHPNKTINPISHSVNSSLNNISIHSISSGEVRFSLPSGISSLRVYDLRGQLLENLSVRNNQAAWLPTHGAGRYFAKAIFERGETVKGFTVVR